MVREKIYESDNQGVHYIVPADSFAGGHTKTETTKQTETKATGQAGAEITGQASAKTASRADDKWTVSRLWDEYQAANPGLKGMSVYRAIFNAPLSRPFGGKQPAELSPFDRDRPNLADLKGKPPK